MYELVFLPIKDLGSAYHNINNDFIGTSECKDLYNSGTRKYLKSTQGPPNWNLSRH